MSMTDQEKLDLYRQTLSQIVYENGGHLRLGEPAEELLTQSGTLMNRLTEDGGIEFRLVFDEKSQ